MLCKNTKVIISVQLVSINTSFYYFKNNQIILVCLEINNKDPRWPSLKLVNVIFNLRLAFKKLNIAEK